MKYDYTKTVSEPAPQSNGCFSLVEKENKRGSVTESATPAKKEGAIGM